MPEYINGVPLLWDEAADGGLLGYGQQQSFSSTATNTATTSYISPFDSSPFADTEVADIADSQKELKILQVEKNHLNSIILCGSGTDVYKRYQADKARPDVENSDLLTLYCEDDEGSNLFDTMYLIQMGGKHRDYIERLKNGDFEKDGIDGKSGNVIKKTIRGLDDKLRYLQILVTEEIKATDSSSSGPKYKIPSIDELEKAMELELMPKEDPNSWLKWYYGIDEWMGEKLSDAASWVGELRFKKDQYNYIEGEAYNPILPIQWVQDIFESIADKLRENKGAIVEGVTKFSSNLKQVANKLDSLKGLWGLPDFIIRFLKKIHGFLSSIVDFVAEIAAKIDTMFETFAASIVEGLRIVNALLCGLIDGLLSLVEGLLQLIAFLVDNVIGWILGMDTDESVSSEGRMKSMNRLEAIEDIYDVLVENWGKAVAAIKVFFTTLSWDKLKELFNDVFANVTRYEVAHFVGSCIFDIIAGVLLAIVTGGGSAIAQAATKAEKFIKLLQLIGREAISAVTLGVYDLAMLLKAFFVRLAKAAAGGFESIYQFFKRLINGFFEVAGAVFEDITEWLLQQYKIAKATIEMFKDLGLVILRNISDNLSGGQKLAVADMSYAIEYKGQRLLEGTEDTIIAFSKKLDDIRHSKGEAGAERWLDDALGEIAERQNALAKWESKFEKYFHLHFDGELTFARFSNRDSTLVLWGHGGHNTTMIGENIKVRRYLTNPVDDKPFDAIISIRYKNGQWIEKQAKSSFFPKNWSIERVKEEIAYVYEKMIQSGFDLKWENNKFWHKNSTGTFEILIEVDKLGNLKSAYPKI